MPINQNPTLNPTYCVEIKQDSQKLFFAKDVPSIELAVKIALHTHEVMNTPHIIHVIHDDIIDCTFVRYATANV